MESSLGDTSTNSSALTIVGISIIIRINLMGVPIGYNLNVYIKQRTNQKINLPAFVLY
jgi:hypothetical protein